MRYSASEKAEIIRLVGHSALPVKRTLEKLGIPGPHFTTGAISIKAAAPKPWAIARPSRVASGTAFLTWCACARRADTLAA
jgi:putative transposase